jgi:hypothetical protein
MKDLCKKHKRFIYAGEMESVLSVFNVSFLYLMTTLSLRATPPFSRVVSS